MQKPLLPRDVAQAIERYWSRWDERAHYKWMKLTDWSTVYVRDVEAWHVLVEYAQHHPIEYMTALVEGYEIEVNEQ